MRRWWKVQEQEEEWVQSVAACAAGTGAQPAPPAQPWGCPCCSGTSKLQPSASAGSRAHPSRGKQAVLRGWCLSGALHSLLDSCWARPSQTSSADLGTFQSHVLQFSICKSKVQFTEVINPVGQGLLLDAGTVPGPGHLCSAWTLPHTLLNKHRCANRGMCIQLYVLLRKSSWILREGEMPTPNAALQGLTFPFFISWLWIRAVHMMFSQRHSKAIQSFFGLTHSVSVQALFFPRICRTSTRLNIWKHCNLEKMLKDRWVLNALLYFVYRFFSFKN